MPGSDCLPPRSCSAPLLTGDPGSGGKPQRSLRESCHGSQPLQPVTTPTAPADTTSSSAPGVRITVPIHELKDILPLDHAGPSAVMDVRGGTPLPAMSDFFREELLQLVSVSWGYAVGYIQRFAPKLTEELQAHRYSVQNFLGKMCRFLQHI